MIHHGFKKGKKVLVICHNGESVIGKFKESTSNYLELEDKKIKWSNVRSSTIYKNRTNRLITEKEVGNYKNNLDNEKLGQNLSS